jgi:hypothetical protein
MSNGQIGGNIPSIQITQMTIDEGTDDELIVDKIANKKKSTEMELAKENGNNGGMAECSKTTKNEMENGLKESSTQSQCQTSATAFLLSANKYQPDRSAVNRQSTGTLNRLILVAQALENEVDWRWNELREIIELN